MIPTATSSLTDPLGSDLGDPLETIKLVVRVDLKNPALQQADDLLKLIGFDLSWLITFVLTFRHRHNQDHIEHALQMSLYQRAEDLDQRNVQLKFGVYSSTFQAAIAYIDDAITRTVSPLLRTLDPKRLNQLTAVDYLGQGSVAIEIMSEDPDDAPPHEHTVTSDSLALIS